jgi:hypothetical protein
LSLKEQVVQEGENVTKIATIKLSLEDKSGVLVVLL